jgi:chromate reductase
MRQPEAYVGGADKLFDAEGMLTNPPTPEFLGKYMRVFAAWIEKADTPYKKSGKPE